MARLSASRLIVTLLLAAVIPLCCCRVKAVGELFACGDDETPTSHCCSGHAGHHHSTAPCPDGPSRGDHNPCFCAGDQRILITINLSDLLPKAMLAAILTPEPDAVVIVGHGLMPLATTAWPVLVGPPTLLRLHCALTV